MTAETAKAPPRDQTISWNGIFLVAYGARHLLEPGLDQCIAMLRTYDRKKGLILLLRKVTFSGVDRYTDIDRLIQLQSEYPAIEYGVLAFPLYKTKGNRFLEPSLLRTFEGTGLNLSLHICGDLTDRVLKTGDWSEVRHFTQGRLSLFARIQINIAKREVEGDKWRLTVPEEVEEVIIQQNGLDDMPMYRLFLEATAKGNRLGNFTTLLDASGGRGVFNNELRALKHPYVGYAGGLGPENVEEFVLALETNDDVEDYWIDMEKSLRSKGDRFSVEVCRKVCECLAEYMAAGEK